MLLRISHRQVIKSAIARSTWQRSCLSISKIQSSIRPRQSVLTLPKNSQIRFISSGREDEKNSWSKFSDTSKIVDVAGYYQVVTHIGMGWWLVAATAAVAGLVLTLELSQVTEDYLQHQKYAAKKAEIVHLQDEEATKNTTFWERRLFDLMVLGRIGNLALLFTPLVAMLPLTLLPFMRRYWWKLLRWTLQTAGGCWIKLGQWASTRPDLFPDDFIDVVRGLQDHCPAHSYAQTQDMIRRSFSAEVEQIFDDFSVNPIASGAIAQVHKARTKLDGQVVAVKILHPGIERLVELDLRIMALGAKLVSYLPTTEFMSLPEAIEEFSGRMISQADLRIEANNLKVFNHNFQDDKYFVFPRLIEDLTRKGVLVETFEVGVPLSDYLQMSALAHSVENKRLARIGLRGYLKMLLYDNFVHADLHPGNLLVRKNAEGQPQLVVLDVGLVSHLSDSDWVNFKDLFKCIVEGNGKGGAALMVSRARGGPSNISEQDIEKFTNEMDVIFGRVRQQKIAELDVGRLLSELMHTLRKYRVKIESNFATLCVATVVLEGIGRQLDPEINILDQSVPFLFWSGKTTLEDRIIYMKEKMKDELIEKDRIKVPDRDWARRMWVFIKQVFSRD